MSTHTEALCATPPTASNAEEREENEPAIKAARAEGNKHDVKSFTALQIVAAYHAALASKPPAGEQKPVDSKRRANAFAMIEAQLMLVQHGGARADLLKALAELYLAPQPKQKAVAWESRSHAQGRWEPCSREYYQQQLKQPDGPNDVRALGVIAPQPEQVAQEKGVAGVLDGAFWRWLYAVCPTGISEPLRAAWFASDDFREALDTTLILKSQRNGVYYDGSWEGNFTDAIDAARARGEGERS